MGRKKLSEKERIERLEKKERVKKFGEVFTPEWLVKKMYDELESNGAKIKEIETTVLEPSCGDGVFLLEALRRKLTTVEEVFGNNLYDYSAYCLVALSSLYGIELQYENVCKCRRKLHSLFDEMYFKVVEEKFENDMSWDNKPYYEHTGNVITSAMYIIECNVVQGNFLTKKNDRNLDITFYFYYHRKFNDKVHTFVYKKALTDMEIGTTPFDISRIIEINDITEFYCHLNESWFNYDTFVKRIENKLLSIKE